MVVSFEPIFINYVAIVATQCSKIAISVGMSCPENVDKYCMQEAVQSVIWFLVDVVEILKSKPEY